MTSTSTQPARPLFKISRALLAVLMVAVLLGAGFKIIRGKAYIWLPDYLRQKAAGRQAVNGVQHVIFLFVDHYEPGKGPAGTAKNLDWLRDYRAFADKHADSYGRKPQHTWFYPYDHKNADVLTDLGRAVGEGYGEVELHWHHGPDTNEGYPAKLSEAVAWFNSYGALVSHSGTVAFGFIHGMWTLDNSGDPRYCGVSRELTFLKDAGAYADFTFPAAGLDAQPSKVNSIYYAEDDERNKSYDTGIDATVGRRDKQRFMIFEGPIALRWSWHVTDAAGVEEGWESTPARVDSWVGAGVGVKGRPEWVFVKAYTHGAQSRRVVFSHDTDAMFSYLETKYGSGSYRLHYVTAREAYNIVRAAEDGLTGDPDAYRNYEVAEPLNKSPR
jgi:hypothetical protein